MTSYVRGKVSKQKRRYRENGFDLDLSYITDKIIAMGFPSESVEGIYRNPYSEVIRFLDFKHKDHFKVYNLCSERSYEHAKFYNRVGVYPFDDHNAPPFELIFNFCKDVEEWFNQHEKNVVVVHCKAGKGRTGLMICCWLIYSKIWQEPREAMSFYAAMRTYNQKGLTIPSQIRYVRYFHRGITNSLTEDRNLRFTNVILHKYPKLPHGGDLRFLILSHTQQLFRFKGKVQKNKSKKQKNKKDDDAEDDDDEDEERFNFDIGSTISRGDVKFAFYEKSLTKKTPLFHFWVNCNFLDNRTVLEQSEIDGANKDKNHKIYPKGFKVELVFQEEEPTPLATNHNQQKQDNTKTNSINIYSSRHVFQYSPILVKYPSLMNL
eukprot:TRINITY_DN200_c1_g2_i1.p1 TRINITY_DN200_c1_g2~~TRINITY_DN200_c1_g2_i1.p1  ORF type:complete len:377 (+),score=137.40 TRINITY_DN200_c1_g2_i1:21-1151(+)